MVGIRIRITSSRRRGREERYSAFMPHQMSVTLVFIYIYIRRSRRGGPLFYCKTYRRTALGGLCFCIHLFLLHVSRAQVSCLFL